MNLKRHIKRILIEEINLKKQLIIAEGKLEDLLQKYDEEYEWIINYFYEEDPTPTNKYFTWLSKVYIDRNERGLETDEDGLLEMVKYFDKNQHKFEKKDIYQYTYDEFIQKYEEAITKMSKREIVSSGVEKLYEDDRYLLIRPKNREASCKYGANTKWCIASVSNNYFDNYKYRNLFFFIIDKLRQPIEGKKRSQNYFKIAIQYEPYRYHWEDKGPFLAGSQRGDITFWNAVDDAVSKGTVTKYVDKDLLKKFIELIKNYTYQLYLNFYNSQLKKQEEFDENELINLKRILTNKRTAYTRARNSYDKDKCVVFVEQTIDIYDNFLQYAMAVGIPKKSLDEILEFKGIKSKYYQCLETRSKLHSIVNQKYDELNTTEEKYNELVHKKYELDRDLNFENI
jgi:hypothetical protein